MGHGGQAGTMTVFTFCKYPTDFVSDFIPAFFEKSPCPGFRKGDINQLKVKALQIIILR